MQLQSSSYETIVKPHLHEVLKYCIYLSGSVWDGEDLYQETLLKTLRYYKSTGTVKEVRPLLYHVARNLWIDEYRSRKRKQITELTNYIDMSGSSYPEIREIMEWLTYRLSDRHIKVWLLAEYFGLSMNEIGERLHMTTSSVRSVLHRARLKLRACLHESIDSKPPVKQRNNGNAADHKIEHWVRCIMRDDPAIINS